MADKNEKMSDRHLWEFDHPYYCEQGSYFKNGYHSTFDSWADFAISGHLTATGNAGNLLYDFDDDLNMLWRWDWKKADVQDFYIKPGDPDDESEAWAEAQKTDRLLLFYMIQRKGYNMSAEVAVTEDDEPAVREWLAKKAAHMRRVWEPLLDEEVVP